MIFDSIPFSLNSWKRVDGQTSRWLHFGK